VSRVVERDPGMQQERTTLAWRRTGLSLLIGSLTIGRLTLDTLGLVMVVATVVTAALAVWVILTALRSRRMAREHPGEPIFSVLHDGRLPVATTLIVAVLAVAIATSATVRLVGAVLS
jgi:uncharacterized membrane protein YidH (DUF202 family)